MPSPLKPNGLLDQGLVTPSTRKTQFSTANGVLNSRSGERIANRDGRRNKDLPKTVLKPVSGDLFYSQSAHNKKDLLSSDGRPNKKRKSLGLGPNDKSLQESEHQSMAYGLSTTGTSLATAGESTSQNESEFMKQLMADIEADPGAWESFSSSPVKDDSRPKRSFDQVQEAQDDDLQDTGLEALTVKADSSEEERPRGASTILGPQSSITSELANCATSRSSPPAVKIEYEQEAKPANPNIDGLCDIPGEDDQDFWAQFSLSQETVEDQDQRKEATQLQYPVWHPLVHPLNEDNNQTKPRQALVKSTNHPEWNSTPWARCCVVSVSRPDQSNTQDSVSEQVLTVADERLGFKYAVKLRGEEATLVVQVGKSPAPSFCADRASCSGCLSLTL